MSRLNGPTTPVAGVAASRDGTTVQVVQTVYAEQVYTYIDYTTEMSPIDNATDGTGFVVSLTPTSVNSRIHLTVMVHMGHTGGYTWLDLYRKIGAAGEWHVVPSSQRPAAGDAQTKFANHQAGRAEHNAVTNVVAEFVDTPVDATSTHFYTLYWFWGGMSLNRALFANSANCANTTSMLTAREVFYA